MQKLFLLSPARVDGKRASLLMNPDARFELAIRFHREGLPLGDVFSFASGLYFRGKITYARQFVSQASGDAIRIITTNRGLLPADHLLQPDDLRDFGTTDIHEEAPRYILPLRRDARALAEELGPNGLAVLLGSIATAKYRTVLLECFGEKLLFPVDFVGRGDMSRGALLLRAAKAGRELPYVPVQGSALQGRRAARIRDLKRS